jgi:hypothetical protein
MPMLSPRLRAQLGLAAAAIVFLVAFSIVLAGTFDEADSRAGMPGTEASSFRLRDLEGNMVSLASMHGSVRLVCFAPPPGSHEIGDDIRRLNQLGHRYAGTTDVQLVAIYSGADDLAPDQMRLIENLDRDAGPKCITLLDTTGLIARRYAIHETPTFLVIDASGIIRYRGGLDDASPGAPLAATSFTSMIDLLLSEKPVPAQPTPAVLSKIK